MITTLVFLDNSWQMFRKKVQKAFSINLHNCFLSSGIDLKQIYKITHVNACLLAAYINRWLLKDSNSEVVLMKRYKKKPYHGLLQKISSS